jgi:hypothetical protein
LWLLIQSIYGIPPLSWFLILLFIELRFNCIEYAELLGGLEEFTRCSLGTLAVLRREGHVKYLLIILLVVYSTNLAVFLVQILDVLILNKFVGEFT